MKSIRAWVHRLAGAFAGRRSEHELAAELDSHLQLHVDDNLRAGMTPDEARRRAMIALGGVESTKEAYRDRRGLPVLESLARDLRYGARTLTRSTTDKHVWGIAGGLGRYVGIDPVIFRGAFGAATLVSGIGRIAYIALRLVLPRDDGAPAWMEGRSRVGGSSGCILSCVGSTV